MPDVGIHDCQGHGWRCFEATGPMANIAMIQQHSDLTERNTRLW